MSFYGCGGGELLARGGVSRVYLTTTFTLNEAVCFSVGTDDRCVQ